MAETKSRQAFFLRNLAKGLVWLGIIVSLFVITKHNVNTELLLKYEHLVDRSGLILFIFVISEIVFGIIPPELFMIWCLRTGVLSDYVQYAALLATISYLAGLLGFIFGRYLHNTRLYKLIRSRYLKKSELLLHDYGLYLILVAALTPLPFSGIAMLIGSVRYPVKKYIYWSLFRFIRFAFIAYVIWEANML